MAAKRIGILTGGGDVPGLNSVIKSVVYRGNENDCEVIGIRRGWEGLTHVNLDDPASRSRGTFMPLDTRKHPHHRPHRRHVSAQSSRTNPSEDEESCRRVLKGTRIPQAREHQEGRHLHRHRREPSRCSRTWRRLGLDYLVAIGGDDTLSYAAQPRQLGLKVIAIPKTMDNDVRNTEYCIGFSTAITRATEAIQRQRTTVGSHERIGIFRVFGRDAGYTALYTAYVTSIRCCIPEYQVNLEKLIELLVNDKQQQPQQLLPGRSCRKARSGRATRCRSTARPTLSATARRPAWPRTLSEEIKKLRRRRNDRQRPDLRTALRRSRTSSTAGGDHLRHMALDCRAGRAQAGLMAAIANGCYATVPIPDPKLGPRKRRDRDRLYNTERYRPDLHQQDRPPIFLTRA